MFKTEDKINSSPAIGSDGTICYMNPKIGKYAQYLIRGRIK